MRAAFRALALRDDALRRRAAVFAWLESAPFDAPLRPSRFSAFDDARDRRADGLPVFRPRRDSCAAFFFVAAEPVFGLPVFTPARRAFESPMAIACFALFAPCFPLRTR